MTAVTTLFKKLRLDDSKRSLIINAPESFLSLCSDLAFDNDYIHSEQGHYDFIMVFAIDQSNLEATVVRLAKAGITDCLFWICYPKGSGKIKSNIKRDTAWYAFELIGFRPVTQIAIDDTWTGLRGRRLELIKKL